MMAATGGYSRTSCSVAAPPLLVGSWEATRGPAAGQERSGDSGAAPAAVLAGAGSAEVSNGWRPQYGFGKNELCTNFAASLQQPQQGAPTLLTLQVDTAAGFAQQAEGEQQVHPQLSPSQVALRALGRNSSSFGDLRSECGKRLLCKDTLQIQQQQQWQWQQQQQQPVEVLEQRHKQHVSHDLRLLIRCYPPAQDAVRAPCVEQAGGRLQNAASAPAGEPIGGASSVLLRSAAGACMQSSNGDHGAATKMGPKCPADVSFLRGPAAAECSGPPRDAARGPPTAATTGARRMGTAAAGRRVEDKAMSCSGVAVSNGFLRSESFEHFLESPYPDDSSGFTSRSTDCSARVSSLNAADRDVSPFCNAVVGGAAPRDGGEATETKEAEVLQQHTKEQVAEGILSQPHKYPQFWGQVEQQEHHRPDQRDQPEQLNGNESEGSAQNTEAREGTSAERANALFAGPPELLKGPQLVSQVRVLQRDCVTGAAEERLVQVLLIHRNPEIFYIPDLLTDEECDHLIHICRGRWERSKTSTGYATAEPREYSSMNSANRTSSSVPLAIGETVGVENVERLAAAFADMNVEHLEPLVIVRYEPGQCFKAHHDGGFRPKTLLLYLNDVEEGGETCFENLGFSISPAKRAGVLWANAYPRTNIIDPRLLHSGLPPTKGTKYVVNCFFNKDPVRVGAVQAVDVPPAVSLRM